MTNSDIEIKIGEIYAKYLKKGNSHKILFDIMKAENIKYKEVDSKNKSFVGSLTKANSGRYYVFTNKNIDNIGRKNFTIAHELGHFFLEHELKSNVFYCLDNEIQEEAEAINPIEREANYFASCFLMPELKIKAAFLGILVNSKKAKIKDFLHVKNDYIYSIWCGIKDDLMNRYGVSESALRYRLTQLCLAKFDF